LPLSNDLKQYSDVLRRAAASHLWALCRARIRSMQIFPFAVGSLSYTVSSRDRNTATELESFTIAGEERCSGGPMMKVDGIDTIVGEARYASSEFGKFLSSVCRSTTL